ncbi:hypothetical protein RRG08_023463 [Elysia crispata]|uniref:Ig-like domain-containing protein n=1 Tax=Elysia crispata TaxID=231223 RepID=A0AAE1AG24_9GAST|nr:hypothetical protein RRG08_023463 [Elysia crispata]
MILLAKRQNSNSCKRNKVDKDVPKVIFTQNPAQTTFGTGDNLELKCSSQGNPDPTLTLTKNEANEVLSTVQTAELTHKLSLGCMDTGVYVCSGQNSQGTTRQEIRIGVRCPQQLSPSCISTSKVNAVIRESAHINIEIYGYPEPSTLTLQSLNDDRNLMSSPRHTVEYTPSVAPFGVVNVTISDLVEADYTNYTLIVDNSVGNALIYTFYLKEVNASSVSPLNDGPRDETERDSVNIAAIVIGVIALLITAGFIVFVVFLRKKIQQLKERLDSQYKMSSTHFGEKSAVGDSVPVSIIEDIPATTDTTTAPAGSPPRARHLSSENAQYETIQDMAIISGTYSSTYPQDVEPPSEYQDLEPNCPTNEGLWSSGHCSNVSSQHQGNHRETFSAATVPLLPATNFVNVDTSSGPETAQSKSATKQVYQNV